MRKLALLFLSVLLVACSSSVNVQDIAGRMPLNDKSIIFDVPSANNYASNMIYIGMLKTAGSAQADKLMELLSIDNISVGISGKNSLVSKALTVYSLEHIKTVGQNVSLYMIGPSEDKVEMEKLASSKNIKLYYFTK
ncbi:Uncharacterised protein [Canicola haemoglobinophilus]|uniref:Lipoprotein n=1 Tax=Canicola haemoglobinophilus TaxID=733 RepID=A0AB38HC03_9PAST|nr:hypothetical protein [Canicola haemoglobinophilus]STO55281.1 Uncharacterised protein [Canicola haemoglobinophilus]STO69149.1 Uncharacterised protein [Canicola haemoglobinophilus]